MPLASGTNLGPYQIQSPLGAGGMGEVYKARDTKLDRSVAIKVLPDALARDPERLARFQREAKVLASLNHPNIAHVYGIEESTSASGVSVRALVMELVPGAPIKGPLPLDTAINYAKQIAEALEAAHEKGIVHRDLKPANIVVTPDDVVKVLDFGLASVENREQQAADPSNSPTMSVSPTRAGMIMGTAAYMSPEQARGKVVDKRTDILAFGAVLYEIIVGKPLFCGETVSDIFVEVLSKEPDLTLCRTTRATSSSVVCAKIRASAGKPSAMCASRSMKACPSSPHPPLARHPQPRHKVGCHGPLPPCSSLLRWVLPSRRGALRMRRLNQSTFRCSVSTPIWM